MRGLTVILCPFCCRAARAKYLPGSRVVSKCNIDKKSITREAVSTLTSSVIQCWYYCTKSFISILQLFRANKPVNIVLWQQYTATLWYAEFYDSVIIELSRFRLEMKYRLCERSFKEFNDFFFHFVSARVRSFQLLFFFFFFAQSRVTDRCNKSHRPYCNIRSTQFERVYYKW